MTCKRQGMSTELFITQPKGGCTIPLIEQIIPLTLEIGCYSQMKFSTLKNDNIRWKPVKSSIIFEQKIKFGIWKKLFPKSIVYSRWNSQPTNRGQPSKGKFRRTFSYLRCFFIFSWTIKLHLFFVFLNWCYSISIEYYHSVKERLSNPYSSILS